ncbi:30S ribosomal protein S10 [Candidatus Gracilibacteria bacterium]|nr:30S ribosomal protein S10 [Candidatus Gracilibacteria bacterium]
MTAKAKAAAKETTPKVKAKKTTTKKAPLKETKVSASSKKETLKISVKAFEHRVVDEAVKKIISAAKDTGSQTVGPIPLPTKIEKFTLNRSTFVNKNAREQFEIRRHRRLLLINEPTAETLEILQKLNLPSGVGVDIAIVTAA